MNKSFLKKYPPKSNDDNHTELHGLYEEPNKNPNQNNNPTTQCYGYRDDRFLRNSKEMAKQYFLW